MTSENLTIRRLIVWQIKMSELFRYSPDEILDSFNRLFSDYNPESALDEKEFELYKLYCEMFWQKNDIHNTINHIYYNINLELF